ncbi:DUF5009 domain-containing protein [Olivibacter sp. CPCC 100613]|uniref:DUF5009 domain-containing protein n=1 Tax=Olivibacter sp. CPCC 100613 TaxID=3079931 RepID=UPI002FFD02D8
MNLEKGHSTRILSIDIMRGFTLLLMLFVNDLYEPGVPFWLLHAPANVDSMGLADWVFPGFLFMVGVSVPYAIRSRLHNGESELRLMGHIIIRTISLLLIGVYMVNIERLNEALTGMNKYCWAILLYLSIFLIWNNYPRRTGRPRFFLCLKGLGLITMIVLAAVFKAGEPGKVLWLATSWWGILGLIGWGYFVATLAYLLFGERKIPLLFIWGFFIGLNILSQLGILTWSGLFGSVFNVVLEGSIPSIVLAGLVVGVLIRSEKKPSKKICFLLV